MVKCRDTGCVYSRRWRCGGHDNTIRSANVDGTAIQVIKAPSASDRSPPRDHNLCCVNHKRWLLTIGRLSRSPRFSPAPPIMRVCYFALLHAAALVVMANKSEKSHSIVHLVPLRDVADHRSDVSINRGVEDAGSSR